MDLQENGEIESFIVDKFIAKQQKNIENNNYKLRKMNYEFDNVFSRYRDYAYEKRMNVLMKDVDSIREIVEESVKQILLIEQDKSASIFVEYFHTGDLKEQALRKDRHLEIEFCRFIAPEKLGGDVKLRSF